MRREPYIDDADLTLYCGDSLEILRELPDESVHMCVTSPPFF
jgi:DNA modification methylase